MSIQPEPQSNPMLKHLEGIPPLMMMKIEARLKVRIREHLGIDNQPSPFLERRVDEMARHILRRLMEKRMNDGRQFDSILAASTKAFGHMLMKNLLEDKQ